MTYVTMFMPFLYNIAYCNNTVIIQCTVLMYAEYAYSISSHNVSPSYRQGLLYDIDPRVQDPLAFAVSGHCFCQHGRRKTPVVLSYITYMQE